MRGGDLRRRVPQASEPRDRKREDEEPERDECSQPARNDHEASPRRVHGRQERELTRERHRSGEEGCRKRANENGPHVAERMDGRRRHLNVERRVVVAKHEGLHDEDDGRDEREHDAPYARPREEHRAGPEARRSDPNQQRVAGAPRRELPRARHDVEGRELEHEERRSEHP